MNTVTDTQPAALAEMDGSALLAMRTRSVQDQETFVEALSRVTGHSHSQVIADLGRRYGMPCIETRDMLEMVPALEKLPLVRAMERGCVLLRPSTPQAGGDLVAVVADPLDEDLQIWIESQAQVPVSYCLASPPDIAAFLAKLEESVRAVDTMRDDAVTEGALSTAEVLSLATASDASAPAVRLINSTLYDALKSAASDVHLESTAEGLSVKLRIDGVLHHALDVKGASLAEQAISRLKVLAELDIAERRVPQDGSFRVQAAGRDIDLRLSVMPSVHGEDAVIRVLDKRAMLVAGGGALSLDTLGFDSSTLKSLRKMAEQPHGMLLVAGPTGSGKTTTLYAAIAEVHTGRDKIITIEDPVEYHLPGVLQIPVHEKKGLTFARGLRSILRHDPDKIMVGEIRDRETAEIAVQAALTGHLVLTTVHANNVFDVFGRFAYLGIDPYLFVSALAGVWAQRLVRINCPRCSVATAVTNEELAAYGLHAEVADPHKFLKGVGCGDCRGTGYRGRRAIAEVLELNDELRELIVDRQPVRVIREAARRHGARTLREAALALVLSGETTLEEVKRVTVEA